MKIRNNPHMHSRRRFATGMAAAALAAGGTRVLATAQEGTPVAGGMTVEESQQLLDSYLEALFGGADFGQFLSDDVAFVHMETGDGVTGREAVVDGIVSLHTEQFAAQPELVNQVVGAGTAGLEVVFVGTHTDEFAGIPATGTAVEVPYAAFYTMADGAITEIRLYGLLAGLLMQLSAAEADATPIG
jgi:ketosteroid isomerase-like protein